MNINVEVIDKPKVNVEDDVKVESSSDVIKIKDVQAIRNAMREYLLFIGLDRMNNVRNISVLGIGTTCNVIIDTKEIVRTALLSASDRVILVHNHPSNSLKPSKDDIHFTNVTKEILKPFNIELLDHIIVTEKDYINMNKIKEFSKEYEDKKLDNMKKGLLLEENARLRQQIDELKEHVMFENSSIDEVNNLSEMEYEI